MFTLLGLTFHLYGLIVGLALAVGISLVEKKAKDQDLAEHDFWSLVIWIMLAGIVGARLWHVVTDFHLYQDQLVDSIKIWNGGLSILGGITGGVIGLWLWQRKFPGKVSTKEVLDLVVFGLPIGQAIGRWGNYVNQELYGLPTNLPWAITIDPEHRVTAFSQQQKFHPLFGYEMIATALFGVWVWWFDARIRAKQKKLVGSGLYFWAYITYYSIVRFGLDFLRVEKSVVGGLGLGVNQIVLIGVIVVSGVMAFQQYKQVSLKLLFMIISGFLLVGCMAKPVTTQVETTAEQLSSLPDRSFNSVVIHQTRLEVEVVHQPASITQGLSGRAEIGSDGMLFVLGQKQIPTFWMKEMLFDLDLVWIDDNKVVGVTEQVPAPSPDVPLELLPRYSPEKPADMVLEIPAGKAKELGIDEGDIFRLATPESNLEK